MDTLRFMGFGEDVFRLLHHQRGSAPRFYGYCESVNSLWKTETITGCTNA
jgi:hypothetical protein